MDKSTIGLNRSSHKSRQAAHILSERQQEKQSQLTLCRQCGLLHHGGVCIHLQQCYEHRTVVCQVAKVHVSDLGAMVITGLGQCPRLGRGCASARWYCKTLPPTGGNPLAVLKKQLGLKMSKIKRRCPLYFTTGEKEI